MANDTSTWTVISQELAAFVAGGGALKLISLYWKKRKDDATNISDLSYTFRKNLEDRLDKLELENEGKEAQILKLSTSLARFEAENKALRLRVKELEKLKQP